MSAPLALALALAASSVVSRDDPLAVRAQAAAAAARTREIEGRAGAADRAAARTLDRAAALAGRIAASEAEVAAARAAVRRIEAAGAAHSARLARVEAPVARLAAALQTMARRPAALALVSPGSVSDLVHTRALLDAAVPAIAARTAPLRAEMAVTRRFRETAEGAVARLRAARWRLAGERDALVRLAARERGEAAALGEAALGESDRALALSAAADDIDRGQEEAARDRRLAEALTGLEPLAGSLPGAAAPPSNWRWPVRGRLVSGFGAMTPQGVRSHGVILATPGATVRAPAAGTVAFAGPFRGYGRVLILAHPGGWTTLLAGLAALDAPVGRRVPAGRPIARVAREITVEVRHGGTPVDVAALAARGG